MAERTSRQAGQYSCGPNDYRARVERDRWHSPLQREVKPRVNAGLIALRATLELNLDGFLRRGVGGIHVVIENLDELGHDGVSAQGREQAAVHVDRSLGFLERSRKRNPDIRVLGFARPVDDAAHHRQLHLFDTDIAVLPGWHLIAQIGLNLLRHLLEKYAGGAPTTRAGRNLRHEAANAERLQNLLPAENFLGAVAVRSGSERNTDGIADAFL